MTSPQSSPLTLPVLEQVFHQQFGFSAFRPGQREALEALLAHRRVLCIQPTGHGKSLLYQLPASVLDGLTLVISPLLALMRDQIGQLEQRFQVPAASINSDQDDDENREACLKARRGQVRILFVAPEQLDNLAVFNFLLTLTIRLLVIDEAHCISTWGHDFRPSYRKIIAAVQQFEAKIHDLYVLALTATADMRTEEDIRLQLETSIGKPLVILRQAMDRPNLMLECYHHKGMAEKLVRVQDLMQTLPKPGLIYCATRENTEIVADYLESNGIQAVAYHAGFPPDRKRELQEGFLAGKFPVVAATNALGMGIDKANLRFVIHFDIPSSPTAYYQEMGRCGRDGLPSWCILLYDSADLRIQHSFIESAAPDAEDFTKVLNAVPASEGPNGLPGETKIKALSGLHPTLVRVILAELEEQDFITKSLTGGKKRQGYQRNRKTGSPIIERYERQKKLKEEALNRLVAYACGGLGCGMKALRTALGDHPAKDCMRCWVCTGRLSQEAVSPSAVDTASDRLVRRPVPIPESQRPPMGEGLSLFQSEMRLPNMLRFMKTRGLDPAQDSEHERWLTEEVFPLFAPLIGTLQERGRIDAVAALPSQGWAARDWFCRRVAAELGVPPILAGLAWSEVPSKRQGELLNNEQRRENVQQRMVIKTAAPFQVGRILLLDDYWGSGATLKETVRAIRSQLDRAPALVPLTMVRVRWKQGKPGIV